MTEYCFETMNWSPTVGHAAGDPVAMVRAAGRAGFSWIAFDFPALRAFEEDGGSLRVLRTEMDIAGLRAHTLHSIRIDGDAAHVEQRAAQAAAYAGTIGAIYLNTAVTADITPGVLEGAHRISAICLEHGLGFATEMLAFLPLKSIGAALRFLDDADIPSGSIVLDAWHFFVGNDSWAALQELDATRIAYVQFSDHLLPIADDILTATAHQRQLPGEGSFDLQRFADILQQIGFDGVVGPEILSRELRSWPLDTYAQRTLQAVRKYWR